MNNKQLYCAFCFKYHDISKFHKQFKAKHREHKQGYCKLAQWFVDRCVKRGTYKKFMQLCGSSRG